MTMPYQTELIDQIVDASSAPDAGVRVSISPARPIMLALEGDSRWAVFSFPSIWRLRSGLLVCSVTIGEDQRLSDADYHYLWFVSDDDGQHWGNDQTILPGADHERSCCNSDVYIIAPDRFLIVYTDYEYQAGFGRPRKAVLVREVIAQPI
jgi:hypothetical protein